MYIRTPNAPAESLSLEEEGGITLVLNERFLPYRPITIGGKQRAEFTWYPGSPEATVQMLGPEEDSIQLRGFWKDKFLGETSVLIGQALNQQTGGLSVNRADNVAALVQAVDAMRRMGRRITLKWSGLMRVGHITGFRQTWHNVHDCEWELDFTVVSQGENTVPVVAAVQITPPDAYQQALKQAIIIQDAIIAASRVNDVLALTNQASVGLNAAAVLVQAATGALYDVARGYTSAYVTVTQGLRRVVSIQTGAIAGTSTVLRSSIDTALSEFYSFGQYGDQDNTPLGVQLAADNLRRTVARDFRATQRAFAFNRRQAAVEATGTNSQVQTLITTADTDLRTVSQNAYGTSDYWRSLMTYNGLSTSRLPAGMALFIPPASMLNAQTTPGGQG